MTTYPPQAHRRRVFLLIGLFAFAMAGAVYGGLTWRKAVKAMPDISARAERLQRRGLRFEDLPEQWRATLIAVQDPGFFEHSGVDFFTPGAGWLTISQELAVQHMGRRFKNRFSALEKIIVGIVLNRRLDKHAQLALYLNTASFGQHHGEALRGFRQAANAWFARPVRALDDAQFTALVGALLAPQTLHPVNHAQASQARVARIARYLSGECQPDGLTDVYYRHCEG